MSVCDHIYADATVTPGEPVSRCLFCREIKPVDPERTPDGRLRFPADVLPWRECSRCGWKWTGEGACPMCPSPSIEPSEPERCRRCDAVPETVLDNQGTCEACGRKRIARALGPHHNLRRGRREEWFPGRVTE